MIIFFALILIPNVSVAVSDDDNAVSKKNLKSFKLDLGDQAIRNEPVPSDVCCSYNQFDVGEPSAGESQFVDRLKVSPEFRYYKQDDDYNDRNDHYDTQVKVKVKVPVDLDF